MRHCVIVDDNRALAEDLGEILHDAGFEVSVFSDPKQAVTSCETMDFDVALLDLRMPGMDGVELFRALSRAHPQAAFILMSAFAEDHRIEQAMAEGVRRVLCKPFMIAELVRALEPAEVSS